MKPATNLTTHIKSTSLLKVSGVYLIYSVSKPDRMYVGSAVNYYVRIFTHIGYLKKRKHTNPRLQGHVNKYGINDLGCKLLEVVENKEILVDREQYYLDLINPSFNISKNARSNLGIKFSEESKKKMSESGKKVNTIERQRRISLLRNLSPESKEKIRTAALGNKYMKGRNHTDISKNKMSLKRKMGDNPKARKVIDTATNKLYTCAKEAAREMNINYKTLVARLNGQNINLTTLKYL